MIALLAVLQMLVAPPPLAAGNATELEVRFWQGTEPRRAVVHTARLPLAAFTCGQPPQVFHALPFPPPPAPPRVSYHEAAGDCVAEVAIPVATAGGEVDARFWGGALPGSWSAVMPIRALAETPAPVQAAAAAASYPLRYSLRRTTLLDRSKPVPFKQAWEEFETIEAAAVVCDLAPGPVSGVGFRVPDPVLPDRECEHRAPNPTAGIWYVSPWPASYRWEIAQQFDDFAPWSEPILAENISYSQPLTAAGLRIRTQ